MARKKQNSKVIMEQKRRRRNILTFWRIVKYGANSFIRNAWLSVAATAVMTVTLLIVFGSILMRMAITNTVDTLTEKIGVSIYLKQNVAEKDVDSMKKSIESLDNVRKVDFTSAKQARENYAQKNLNDAAVQQALIESSNEFFSSFSVTLDDIGNTASLEELVNKDKTIQANLHETKQPTYKSSRKESIDALANGFSVVEKVGLAAGILFVFISSLIIFNTIRMAIFNRREEIYMMKLIGANKGFISGPFLIESVICGVLASFLASFIGYFAVSATRPKLEAWGVSLDGVVTDGVNYIFVILPLLMILGMAIGVISSLVATRKYLKL